jgi:PadR family transcriptional regulator, regulatory protein PadR
MRGESLKGHLDLLILAVLSQGPLHGYAVIEELRARSDDVFDLPEGTVYPALHRLEKAGLLTSSWSGASGRRRRTYDLTRDGRAALVSGRSSWADFSSAVTSVLRGPSWSPT